MLKVGLQSSSAEIIADQRFRAKVPDWTMLKQVGGLLAAAAGEPRYDDSLI
jgi:hypothetical protein